MPVWRAAAGIYVHADGRKRVPEGIHKTERSNGSTTGAGCMYACTSGLLWISAIANDTFAFWGCHMVRWFPTRIINSFRVSLVSLLWFVGYAANIVKAVNVYGRCIRKTRVTKLSELTEKYKRKIDTNIAFGIQFVTVWTWSYREDYDYSETRVNFC